MVGDNEGARKPEPTAWRNPLSRIRPSQLILLSVLPFVIYLFFSSAGYQQALRFIFGVEDNSFRVFITFLLLIVGLVAGLYLSISILRRKPDSNANKPWQFVLLAIYIICLFFAFRTYTLLALFAFLGYIQPPQFVATFSGVLLYILLWILLVASVLLQVLAFFSVLLALFIPKNLRLSGIGGYLGLAANIIPLIWLIFFSNLGFASGILVTIRVAIFAYLASSILGITLAGLLILTIGEKTLGRFLIAGMVVALASIFFFTRPKQDYTLVGSIEGRVAIVKGTPDRIADQIKARIFLDPQPVVVEGEKVKAIQVRGVDNAELALTRLQEGVVTGAFIPTEQAPADLPKLWQTTFLPDSARNPGVILLTFGIFLLLLTFGGWSSGHHPLAVFAELYVDLMRGIPMLVIILYVGFPIIGAIRDATGGAIDIPLLVRGVVGISLGYAAYMAEIFRAGIQAIPKGQYEASRSLGLTGWQSARFIILPQALRIVIPPLGNEFIAMVKDTSLLSVLSVRDITQRAREFSSATFQTFPPFNTVAVLYIVLTLAASSLVKYVERRTEAGKR